MDLRQDPPVIPKYIELRANRNGMQKPYIIGTRIGVDTIYVCYELQGMTPDEIHEAFPHVSLAQIHFALAYYYDNPGEIREQVKRDRAFADELEAKQGPTKYSTLRDALLGGECGRDGNPLSS